MAKVQHSVKILCLSTRRAASAASAAQQKCNVRRYSDEPKKQNFFQKLMDSTSMTAHTDAHSKTLTSNAATYELQCMFLNSSLIVFVSFMF